MRNVVSTTFAVLAIPALAQWELVVKSPTNLTNGLPADVRVASLMGKPLATAGGGTVWALGKEGPARDNYNRLAERGAVPTQYPALIHESGCIIQPADAQAITEREARRAAWSTSTYPVPHSVVPMLDTNGVQVGTARLVVDVTTLHPIAVINSASPQREWQVQKDQYKTLFAAYKAEKDQLKADIASLKAKADKASTDLAAMKADVDKAKADIVDLKAKVKP